MLKIYNDSPQFIIDNAIKMPIFRYKITVKKHGRIWDQYECNIKHKDDNSKEHDKYYTLYELIQKYESKGLTIHASLLDHK